MTTPAVSLQLLLLGLAAIAGFLDMRTRRIPNWLVVVGIVSGISLNCWLFRLPGLRLSLEGCGLALLIYIPLFALRAVSGGDAKLMAAAGAIVGPGNWLTIFFLTALLGGVIAVVIVVARKRLSKTIGNIFYILRELALLRPPYLQREDLAAGGAGATSLPHGAVIALAVVLFLLAARVTASSASLPGLR